MNTATDRYNASPGSPTARRAWIGAAAVAALCLPLTASAVTLTPSKVIFQDYNETHEFRLEHEGAPVDASAIQSVSLNVSEHDYNHMIDVTQKSGAIVITPTDMLEIGVYELVVQTDHGEAVAVVESPLTDLDASLESRADDLGITVEELKQQLGLGKSQGRGEALVTFPRVLYVGQSLELPNAIEGNDRYVWYVDGEEVEAERNRESTPYVFDEPGVHVIAGRAPDAVELEGYTTINLVHEPKVLTTMEPGARAVFEAPRGYDEYTWTVDGKPQEGHETCQLQFMEAGTYIVEVEARSEDPGAPGRYRRVTYEIEVS